MSGQGWNQSQTGTGWLSLPLLCALIVLFLGPMLATVLLSFFQFDALSAPRFVAWDHFASMSSDPMLQQALHNSMLVACGAVPLRLGLALLLGLLFAIPGRLSKFGLVFILLPVLLPEIVWSMAWLWLLNPHFGPAAALLEAWQPRGSQWLLSAEGARASIVAVTSLMIGELVLIIAVVRQRISPKLYAVNALEGGSAWYAFKHITLPLLWPILLLLAARDISWSMQLSYMPSLFVTKTGPQFASYFLPNLVYQNAFEYLRFGYASAVSCLILLCVLVMATYQALWLRQWTRT